MKRKKRTESEVSSRTRKQSDGDSWREPLEAIAINDDEWWCIVTMMVETIPDHSRCVSIFNEAADVGKRKAIQCLSYQKMLSSIRALSKQSTTEKYPAIQGVCHYASKILDAGEMEALPSWLMAWIIKYFIYRAREDSIGRVKRLADLEREIDEEYWIMQTVADWGQPGMKKFDPDIFNKKANTRLRKRGEEWRDAVYVDDAPLNGPNLYIILTGFHDPDLPVHLRNVGVPLYCMLQIKRPSEKLQRIQTCTMIDESESRKLYFLEEYSVSKIKLFNFWSQVEKRLTEPEKYPEYSDIGFLVFCPPQLPDTLGDDEYTALKKDLYDRVSYIVYDFYDLYRQHGNYLKSMKVEKSIIAENASRPNMDIYDIFLSAFPLECISVPTILFAILTQVEASERTAAENSMDEKGDARASFKNDIEIPEQIEENEQTPASLVEQKVKALNIKFGMDIERLDAVNAGKCIKDIEIVLFGDILNKAVHLLDDCAVSQALKPTDLLDLILTIFRHPITTNIRKKHQIPEKKLNQYKRHLNRIRHYFDAKLTNEEVRHYLHMLIFDEMIFKSSEPKSDTSRTTLSEKSEDFVYSGEWYSVKRCKSLPSLSSNSRPDVHFLSDGNIDYGLVIPEIISCSALFDLIDPRELLVPGYLKKNVFGKRTTNKLRLEDFSDAELLSRPIFLQLLHECLLAFDQVEFRYFEPTDSLLLYFSNKWRINGVNEEERMSSIRTPVQLRDFCKYVVPEEEDWLRREEELYRLQTAEWMERLMRESSEIYEETMVFCDEDFILPGTLKAKDLEKSRELDKPKAKQESAIVASTESTVKGKTKKERKVKEKKDKSPKKNRRGKLGHDKASSARPSLKEMTPVTPETEEEPVYDFIGYDIGTLRVQVTNRKKTFFSADNTLVQVEMDYWLYKSMDLRITVSLHGYTLRLFHRVDKPQANKMFHLTSRAGIILAFQKLVTTSRSSKIPYHNWQEMNIELRASWPTGLIIESVLGDGPQNPYYIQQSYIPKGHHGTDGNREVCRKFLRNGTLLKYLEDSRIIVFRPNGVIVTCTEFKTSQPKEGENYGDQADTFRSSHAYASGDKVRESKNLPRNRKKSKPELHGEVYGDSGQQQPTMNEDDVSSLADGTVRGRQRVSRYTVVNHDGGRYEVLDDLIVSEQHRLLVRMASDYEVDEKFTRRADGTNMLLNSNGELIVRFPDGTRITTGYRIEEEPAMCDWTEEEILRYFTTDGIKEYEEQYVEPSLSSLRYNEEASSSRRNVEYEEKVNELLIAESFVSVLLTCRMEHKNYTTVSYDQSAVNCILSMPDDLRVSISERDHYEVSMADGVNLKIDKDGLSFKGNACTLCGRQSTSIYNFHPFDQSDVIFTVTDVFGNTFEVQNDGSTWYYPNDEEELNTYTDELNKGGEYCEGGFVFEGEETAKPSCSHETLNFESSGIHYRIFSLNQDLTAYEYIHRRARDRTELMALYDKETSMFLYPSSHRPELDRLITFEPLGAESQLKDALSFPDYPLRSTNFDRRDILRSTYSIPYDWLFPFGRNGNGIRDNTHDLPLIEDVKPLPWLLRTRILRGFKQPGRNAIVDLQQALGNYWMSLVRNTLQSHVDQEKSFGNKRITKTFQDLTEDKLQLLSLGIKNTIGVETYKMGLEKEWKTAKPKTQGTALERFLDHKMIEKEVLDWYKRCLREKYILPYFENITGTCFLWIMDCMTAALKVSVSSEWNDEGKNFWDHIRLMDTFVIIGPS